MASPTEMLGAPSQYYLEDFSESIATLPAELNKNLTLMGELDAHATEAFKVPAARGITRDGQPPI